MTMESFDFLKGIRASNNYEFALLTTYDFDIGFFESFILNSLINNGVKKVTVYTDGEQLVTALGNVTDSYIGKRYVVNPIRINAAFHPKLFLLLGQNKAKLYVSSANLTTSGFCINNEIVNEFIYDIDHPENLKVISQAITFFEKIDTLSFGLEKELFNEIKQLSYYGKSNINQALFLIDNIEEPILDQIQEIIQTTETIDVAVPYYDNALNVIEELEERFPNAFIRIFLQNGKSRFPMWRINDNRFTVFPFQKISSVNDGKETENCNFYHGKVLRFKDTKKSIVVYGSANCTKSALTLSHKNGGNIECNILEVGKPEDFDTFFGGFIEDTTELNCEKLNDEVREYPNFLFLFGTIKNSKVQLTFDCSKQPQHLVVTIGNNTLPFNTDHNRIEVTIESELLEGQPEVFSVSFISEKGEEKVKCWILYKDYLDLFRLPDETGGVYSFDINSAGDKYIQDRYALLSKYALSVEDILRESEIERHFQMNISEPDPENNDDEEDGIIDYTPPSADIIQQHKIIGRIRLIESAYRDSFTGWITEAMKSALLRKKAVMSPVTAEPIHIYPDQTQSFIRFIKAQYKKLMNSEYQEKVDPERFFSVILVFFEIFDKYTIFSGLKPDEMLLRPLFIAESKSQLLLSINKMSVSEKTEEDLIVLTFLTVIINHILNSKENDSTIDKANQKLLASIKQDDTFRTHGYIEQVLKAADMLSVRSVEVSAMSEINYVDSLFGYKPLSKVKETIQNDYGKNCLIYFDNEQISVETKVESISSFMTMREGSLRDLNNYVKMQGRFKSLFIDIVLQGINKGPNPATRITYLVSNLPNNSVRQRIYRKNGKIEESVMNLNITEQ